MPNKPACVSTPPGSSTSVRPGLSFTKRGLKRVVVAIHPNSFYVEWSRPGQESWRTSFSSFANWDKWVATAILDQ